MEMFSASKDVVPRLSTETSSPFVKFKQIFKLGIERVQSTR